MLSHSNTIASGALNNPDESLAYALPHCHTVEMDDEQPFTCIHSLPLTSVLPRKSSPINSPVLVSAGC